MRDVVHAPEKGAVATIPEVIVADRQVIVCQGLGSLVAKIPEVQLGAFANDKASLRKALRACSGPAIVVLGVRLVDADLTRVLDMLRRDYPKVMVVVVAEETEFAFIRTAIKAGAHSICMMGQVLTSLPQVLVRLVEGHSILPMEVLKRLTGEQGDILTRREHEILGLLVDGLTNFQISARLGLSENTVKYYLKAIYQKLDVISAAAPSRNTSREPIRCSVPDPNGSWRFDDSRRPAVVDPGGSPFPT